MYLKRNYKKNFFLVVYFYFIGNLVVEIFKIKEIELKYIELVGRNYFYYLFNLLEFE